MTPHDMIAALETLAEAPEGVKRLRELLLQLAVMGKLVPQDPEDEAASRLLERIRAEKGSLVKEGRIRKAKGDGPVGPEERSFEIPRGWSWARLDDLAHDHGQCVPDDDFSYIDVGSIDNHRGAIIDDVSVIAADAAPSRARKLVRSGTVIYSTVRPYLLNVAIVEREYSPRAIASTAFAVLHAHTGVSNRYLFRLLRSYFFVAYVEAQMKGVAYPAINDASLLRAPVPVPPTAEQHRIVARVDELMSLLDRLEAARNAREATREAARNSALAALQAADTPDEVEIAWSRLAERMDELFMVPADVDPLRQAVLQLAVRGRLVRQEPGDEPASRLLERIATEKARLIKEGKIRKAEPADPVSKGDAPFDLPDGWAWCRLDHILRAGPTNGWSPKAADFDTGVRTLKLSATTKGKFDPQQYKFVDEAVPADSPLWLVPGDLLIQRSNTPEYVGMAAVYDGEPNAFIYPDLMMRCRTSQHVLTGFVHIALISPFNREWLSKMASGTSQSMVKLNQRSVSATAVPFPPLAEQHRIVAKVDELMTLLDRLEERLRAKTSTHDAFAAAAVHHLDLGLDREPVEAAAPAAQQPAIAPRAPEPFSALNQLDLGFDRPAPLLRTSPERVAAVPNDLLAASLDLLRSRPVRDLARADFLDSVAGLNLDTWLPVAKGLAAHPDVIRTGERKGTRYRWRA